MASITKRNNSYIIRVSLGRDITGKQLMKNATFTPPPGLTKKQEERAVNEFAFDFEQKARNGLIMDGRQITLKEFCERWLAEVAPVRLEASTVPKYKRELDDKILPALGHMKLTDIRPHTVSKFYFSLTQDGVRKDKHPGGYSVCTIRKAHAILSSILTTAEKWELIPSNPCDKAEIPQDRSTEEKLKYFDTEQAIAFLDYLEKPYTVTVAGHIRVDDTGKPYTVGDYEKAAEWPLKHRALFNLALFSGMRKGELLGLRWEDVDWENNQIKITRAIAYADGGEIVKQPKTKSSRRTVTVPGVVMNLLRAWKREQIETRLYLGDYWQEDGWIFTQENGKRMNYATPRHTFHQVLEQYNKDHPKEPLPLIPFHGLRHTSATLLIADHQDIRSVAARLGHSQTSTTLNIYAHALRESDQKAADSLETMLRKHA